MHRELGQTVRSALKKVRHRVLGEVHSNGMLLLLLLPTLFAPTKAGHPVPDPDGPYMRNPCLNGSRWSHLPFCDTTLGLDERAADIVQRLSAAERITALGSQDAGFPSVGLLPYDWWSEATHGISHVRDGPNSSTPFESNFALPITTAAAFNRSLWMATGRAIGTEARAFMNAGNAYSTFWAPVVNLVRDPRWGRNVCASSIQPTSNVL